MPQPAFTVTFLGTGTSGGVPLVGCSCYVCQSENPKDKRLRSSIMIETATTRIVVDATPDFRQQMLLHEVKKLNALVLTHPHKDHIGGIDDTRPFQYLQKSPTLVYGSAYSIEGVKREIPYAFTANPYPGVPQIELHTIDQDPFQIGDLTIQPVWVWHHKMPVQGFRIGAFTYITDANRIDPYELKKIEGSHTLVLNALRKQAHISHFTLQQAIDLSQSLKMPQTYFTHISHQLGLHSEINAELPHNIALAYDGLKLHF